VPLGGPGEPLRLEELEGRGLRGLEELVGQGLGGPVRSNEPGGPGKPGGPGGPGGQLHFCSVRLFVVSWNLSCFMFGK